ncbi:S-adenosyl-L-methionine-dependent methyltransferase [Aspergillus undulatus]|uniref:S-adenosyl-L-methionine-dependent methyltransferase n=1 Tax=Aspergillus undulatus TaxID=1810928 RepID=UPI003CCCBB11
MQPGINSLPRTGLAALLAQLDLPGEIQLPNGSIVAVCNGNGSPAPVYRVIFRSERALRTPMNELAIGEAYITDAIDVEGNLGALFSARQHLREKVPLRQKIQFAYDYLRTATKMNSQAIVEHYDRGDELYHAFIDKDWRFYSQGLFQSGIPEKSIEEASRHKLNVMWDRLGLKAGMRILDIGGGWGGVTQYCSPRGVHVTTLTLSHNGARYIQQLIEDKNLSGRAQVYLQDFLNHNPTEPYDAAVSLGSIEHLPDYRRFARTVYGVLKPGGRLYLDGSATVTKFAASSFTRRYVWPGAHTFMTVQDVMGELLLHGFEVMEIVNETRDYSLTMFEWARRLDEARDEIIAGWGEETYRVFRIFLWGGAHAFETNSLQAYHIVAERTPEKGPRPGTLKRIVQFLGKLR